jgi:hypothetical protein
MNKKPVFFGMLAMALVCGVLAALLAACGNTPLPPTAEELARRYVGAEPQFWGPEDDRDTEPTYVYHVDPNRFEQFRTELERSGVLSQVDSWTETDRGWEKGKTFARFAQRPDYSFRLSLCTADNKEVGYSYEATTGASESDISALKSSLSKYVVPSVEYWDSEDGPPTYVYFLDPDHFEDFKAELDAGGRYVQDGEGDSGTGATWIENDFALWAERPDGTFQLDLYKADNSFIRYNYR